MTKKVMHDNASEALVVLVIPGRPKVLKNSKRILGRGRRKIVLPSVAYAKWEAHALASLRGRKSIALIDEPLTAHYRFYFANRQSEPDVSNLIEGPQDVLAKAGVIANDRLIMRVTAEKFFGRGEARTEISLYAYEASA